MKMNFNYTKGSVMRLDFLDKNLMEELVRNNLSTENWDQNRSYGGLDYGSLMEGTVSTGSSSDLPFWVQAAWTFVFGIMIFIAIGGNCIVIWIVLAHRQMRTVTNYFLVNLSIADLLLSLFNCTFNSIYMIHRNWPFGTWYCTISNFIANSTVAASVFTLTGISCDRYLAIVHPLQPRMSRASSLITILFIWTTSMIIAFPCLIYSATITHRHKGTERVGCILIWPDKKEVGSTYDLWYQMLFLLITYIVPIILMTMCYSVMGKVLWGSRSIGELTQRQIDSMQSKRKVVKMFILVVIIFGLCWLPYHSYFIYVYFDTTVIYSKYTQHVYLSFYWFAMSNAMVNPLIYYWMNARFRQYFKTAVCGWKRCFDKRPDEIPPPIRNSQNSSRSVDVNGIIKQRSQKDYQHGNAHYSLLAGTNGIAREQIRRMSNRTTRTTSLRKDFKKTTYL